MSRTIPQVLFAPDYRAGNPYQTKLAASVEATGDCRISFSRGYRRVLPLTRMIRDVRPDLLHLHWPEAYAGNLGALDGLRRWRLALDLGLARQIAPCVMTAHNLWPHHLPRTAGLKYSLGKAYRNARAVIAHSAPAAEMVAEMWGVARERITVIPHGNPVEGMILPAHDPQAGDYALNFGTIAPYKGIEELIGWWRRHRPPVPLRITGIVNLPDYPEQLRRLIDGDEIIQFRPGRISDEELMAEVVNARVVVINHIAGLTSTVAALARSLSTNLLLPRRLSGVDLMEPHPSVFRFDQLAGDFESRLAAALHAPRSPHDEQWWQATSWASVAAATVRCYQKALSD